MEKAEPEERFLILVSSYTHGFFAKDVKGDGVSILFFEPKMKKLEVKSVFNEVPNLSFLAFSMSDKIVLGASEMDFGALVSLELDEDVYSLKLIDSLETKGKDACHICLDPKNEIVIVTNYTSGNFSIFSFDKTNGKLIKNIQTVELKFLGNGPILDRQQQAHAHCAVFEPTYNSLYISDLGGDKIHIFHFDPKVKQAVPFEKQPYFKVEPGLGPRHLCLSKDGRFLYSVNELKPILSVFSVKNEKKDGSLVLIQTIKTIFENPLKENYNAEIQIHPSNKFLFSSNRGYDVISIYSIDEKTGLVSFIKHQTTLGKIYVCCNL